MASLKDETTDYNHQRTSKLIDKVNDDNVDMHNFLSCVKIHIHAV